MKTGYQLKSFSWSFAIHALILMTIFGISRHMPSNKPVVIDFSIEDSEVQTTNEIPGKPQIKRETTSIKKTAPSPAINEKHEIRQETRSYEPSPQQEAVSEDQAPVDTPHPIHDSAQEKAQDTRTVQSGNLSDISNTATESSSDISTGDTHEKSKARYIELNYAHIKDRIQKSISYPLMARKMGMEGKVIISFIVRENGEAEEMKILKSSGFSLLDKNVIETIKKILPFPTPPVRAELIVPVTYRLN